MPRFYLVVWAVGGSTQPDVIRLGIAENEASDAAAVAPRRLVFLVPKDAEASACASLVFHSGGGNHNLLVSLVSVYGDDAHELYALTPDACGRDQTETLGVVIVPTQPLSWSKNADVDGWSLNVHVQKHPDQELNLTVELDLGYVFDVLNDYDESFELRHLVWYKLLGEHIANGLLLLPQLEFVGDGKGQPKKPKQRKTVKQRFQSAGRAIKKAPKAAKKKIVNTANAARTKVRTAATNVRNRVSQTASRVTSRLPGRGTKKPPAARGGGGKPGGAAGASAGASSGSNTGASSGTTQSGSTGTQSGSAASSSSSGGAAPKPPAKPLPPVPKGSASPSGGGGASTSTGSSNAPSSSSSTPSSSGGGGEPAPAPSPSPASLGAASPTHSSGTTHSTHSEGSSSSSGSNKPPKTSSTSSRSRKPSSSSGSGGGDIKKPSRGGDSKVEKPSDSGGGGGGGGGGNPQDSGQSSSGNNKGDQSGGGGGGTSNFNPLDPSQLQQPPYGNPLGYPYGTGTGPFALPPPGYIRLADGTIVPVGTAVPQQPPPPPLLVVQQPSPPQQPPVVVVQQPQTTPQPTNTTDIVIVTPGASTPSGTNPPAATPTPAPAPASTTTTTTTTVTTNVPGTKASQSQLSKDWYLSSGGIEEAFVFKCKQLWYVEIQPRYGGAQFPASLEAGIRQKVREYDGRYNRANDMMQLVYEVTLLVVEAALDVAAAENNSEPVPVPSVDGSRAPVAEDELPGIRTSDSLRALEELVQSSPDAEDPLLAELDTLPPLELYRREKFRLMDDLGVSEIGRAEELIKQLYQRSEKKYRQRH